MHTCFTLIGKLFVHLICGISNFTCNRTAHLSNLSTSSFLMIRSKDSYSLFKNKSNPIHKKQRKKGELPVAKFDRKK